MPIKSIIDIEINDAPWTRFKELFDQYRQQLKESAKDWQTTSAAIDEASTKTAEGVNETSAATESLAIVAASAAAAFHEIATAVTRQSVEIVKAVSGSQTISKESNATARNWHNMAKDSKDFATNIYEATRSLLKWSTLTGVIGGLLGGGGLFGIDRLATAAGSQRRSALGLGVNSGEERAFDLNYGRVVDSQNFLSGVNEAMLDVTKRWTLTASGLSPNQIQGKNTAEVSGMLLPRIKTLADQTNPNNLEQLRTSLGISQFMSLRDLERLRNTPASEVAGYGKSYEADRKNLAVPDGVLKAWQDLQTQLGRAGTQLENVLINGLVRLAEPIGKLSKSVVDLFEALAKSPVVKGWIETLAEVLEKFAKWIGSPDFEKDVLKFVTNVGKLAISIGEAAMEFVRILERIKKIFGGGEGVNGPLGDNAGSPGSPAWRDAENERRKAAGQQPLPPAWNLNPADPEKMHSGAFSGYQDQGGFLKKWWGGLQNWWGGVSDKQKFAYNQFEDEYKLPRGLLSRVEYKESGGRGDLDSPQGAKGYFQFKDETARDYGVNVRDEMSSANGAARYLSDLLKRKEINGDLEKGLAAYNWGPGHLKEDIDKHGDQWKDFLPDETKKYIGTILGGGPLGAPGNPTTATASKVSITVYNNTGGAAAITTSQLAI